MTSFNLSDYCSLGDTVCMNCQSVEEAEIFTDFLAGAGRRWRGGESYEGRTHFNNHEENTCYFFNEGTYGSIKYANDHDCLILYFSDFLWDIDYTEDNECSAALNGFLSQFQLRKEVSLCSEL